MLSYNVLNSWVEKMMKKSLPVKIKTSDITNLSTKDINKLKAGDIVLKKTGNQKHAYIVSYKEDNQGICLTYNDALYTETVSYDYDTTTKTWIYNSTDKTVIQKELTEGDNITITDAGVISATDTTYTAGANITIENGVISAAADASYDHIIDLSVSNSGGFSSGKVYTQISTKSNTPFYKDTFGNTFSKYLYDNQFRTDSTELNASGYIVTNGVTYMVMGIFATTNSNLSFTVMKTTDFSITTLTNAWYGTGFYMSDKVI